MGSEDAINAARADITKRTAVNPSAIRVVVVEAAEWPDSSLGCPQPDRFYAQVITPGYRIVLEVGGTQYEYHTDAGSTAVFCARP